jgi:hypothetical protein
MTSSITLLRNFLVLGCLLFSTTSFADTEPSELPLFSIEQLEYQGAFRLPANQLGESSANWANGTIAYNHRNHSIFFAGHNQHQAIAEFKIPEIIKSDDIIKLNTAYPIQEFVRLFNRVKSNPDGQDRITGMYFDYGRLIINTMKYYDAAAKAKNTTIVISNVNNLQAAKDLQFYQLEYGARAAGWMSSIPTPWKNLFKADLVVGNGNGRPINARLSIGPSALLTNVRQIVNADLTEGAIPLQPLQLYSLQESLHDDLKNQTRTNKLLTELSRPVYGFIIPNTRTYMVVGSSGGHRSGVGYKLKRKDGSECPGFCANDINDMVNYYWLFDANNWSEVISGQKLASQVQPYSFGELKLPFSTPDNFKPVTGATFSKADNILYISLDRADTFAGDYNNPPLILELKLNI